MGELGRIALVLHQRQHGTAQRLGMGIVTLTHLITYIAYMMVRGGAPND